MSQRIYQVDAFTDIVFGGNPAAVMPLDTWLPDRVLQDLAAENNLAETAFFVPEGQDGYRLRWFTPTTEVDLCGHATLASAFVIMTILRPGTERVEFATQVAGTLSVTRSGDLFTLDFPPARPSRHPVISIRSRPTSWPHWAASLRPISSSPATTWSSTTMRLR